MPLYHAILETDRRLTPPEFVRIFGGFFVKRLAAQTTKKNGDPGVNGAANHALNAYDKIAEAYREAGGCNLGELTVKLKEYTEAKVQKAVEAYLNSKVQPGEAPGQTALPLDVPDPVVVGGGAAYNL